MAADPWTVGRYEILRELGRGGMAVVYLARQTDLDRDVALKQLASFHATDPDFGARFVRESRLAGSLKHPNVVTVHDYFVHEGAPFIAMEYVERGSLRPRVGTLTLAQIAGVLEGLLAGLAHAHGRGVVHRDLKPENLMVTGDGGIKIADFGIAKALDPTESGFVTATGMTVGTPAYMAPEQAMGEDVGPWTDLYSSGAIAYELLTGRVPFHETTRPMAILLRHVNDPVPPLHSLQPDVDARLAAWVERLLAKTPGERPASAREAWEGLEETVLDVLGPMWRRNATLPDGVAPVRQPAPAPVQAEPPVTTPALPPPPPPPAVPAPEPAPAPAEPTFAFPSERPPRTLRRLWVVPLLLVAGAAAGVVAVTAFDRLGADERSSGTTSVPVPASTGPPAVASADVKDAGPRVVARLHLGGRRLPTDAVHLRDAAIRDGRALVTLAAPGIRTGVTREAGAAVDLRLTRESGRVLVAITTRAGAFTSVGVGRPSDRVVSIALRKIARPTSGRAAALALVDAWRTADRPGALSVAEPSIVERLFARAFPEPAPKLQDCGAVGTDQIECGFEYDFGRQVVGFKSQKFGGFYRVLELSFIP